MRDEVVAAVAGAPRAAATAETAARVEVAAARGEVAAARMEVAAAEETAAAPVVPAVVAMPAVGDLLATVLAIQQEGPHQGGVHHEGE